MSKLASQIKNSLPNKISLPDEIEKLLDWIESNGCVDEFDGVLMGTLPGELDYKTEIEFYAENDTPLWWCFDSEIADEKEISERVYIFARTGGDGSSAAFWIDDKGNQKIVHIGSGSGSTMMCVLADKPVDFIRLLAIGYEEICWNEEYSAPPQNSDKMNKDLKKWIEGTFNVNIPTSGTELVPIPAEMWDINSADPFCRWISNINEHDF